MFQFTGHGILALCSHSSFVKVKPFAQRINFDLFVDYKGIVKHSIRSQVRIADLFLQVIDQSDLRIMPINFFLAGQ